MFNWYNYITRIQNRQVAGKSKDEQKLHEQAGKPVTGKLVNCFAG